MAGRARANVSLSASLSAFILQTSEPKTRFGGNTELAKSHEELGEGLQTFLAIEPNKDIIMLRRILQHVQTHKLVASGRSMPPSIR